MILENRTLHQPTIKFSYNEKIICKSSDFRIYKDAILLTPGTFSDSVTRAPVIYEPDVIAKGSTNWSENYLNIDHSTETLKRVGYVRNTCWKNNSLRGDLYILPLTDAGKDVIALIDAGLVNWLSVELSSKDRWNSATRERYANDLEFFGCAVVLHPADPDTRIVT